MNGLQAGPNLCNARGAKYVALHAEGDYALPGLPLRVICALLQALLGQPKNVAADAALEREVPSLAWRICTTHAQPGLAPSHYAVSALGKVDRGQRSAWSLTVAQAEAQTCTDIRRIAALGRPETKIKGVLPCRVLQWGCRLEKEVKLSCAAPAC